MAIFTYAGELDMTIVEAIKTVLYQMPDGLTSKEIYDEIVKQNLYSFGAKNPLGVVNSQIRRRCAGLDFPTAYPVKVCGAHEPLPRRALRARVRHRGGRAGRPGRVRPRYHLDGGPQRFRHPRPGHALCRTGAERKIPDDSLWR